MRKLFFFLVIILLVAMSLYGFAGFDRPPKPRINAAKKGEPAYRLVGRYPAKQITEEFRKRNKEPLFKYANHNVGRRKYVDVYIQENPHK